MLEQLRLEEALLSATRSSVQGLHAALRRGDLPALNQFHVEQERLAGDLHRRAAIREGVSAALADALGLTRAPTALRDIAGCLPPDEAALLFAQRDRLRTHTDAIAEFQRANANLIAHLRSYFRGVLAPLADEGIPTRYGPAGLRRTGGVGLALHATG